MLLSKRAHASWLEIQDEYEDTMTSLGPWTAKEVIEFLREEYPGDVPFTPEEVRAFEAGDAEVLG